MELIKIYITDKISKRLEIASRENAIYTGNPLSDNIVKGIREMELWALMWYSNAAGSRKHSIRQSIC